ncbi:MAG TPA: hypothetical protein VF695_02695 [Sphingomonas sp.]
MALKDMIGIIDNKLVDIFNRPSFDADKARKPLLRGIARTLDQFEGGKVNAPGRWWFVKNDVVALTVKLDGDILEINGVGTNHMPAERFPEFLAAMRTAVEAGEFDDVLAARNHQGDTKVRIPRAKRQGGTPRAWSDEQRARYQATLAARRAKQQA